MTTVNTPVGIRTPNLLIRSQTLYPVELRAHEQLLGTALPPRKWKEYSTPEGDVNPFSEYDPQILFRQKRISG